MFSLFGSYSDTKLDTRQCQLRGAIYGNVLIIAYRYNAVHIVVSAYKYSTIPATKVPV